MPVTSVAICEGREKASDADTSIHSILEMNDVKAPNVKALSVVIEVEHPGKYELVIDFNTNEVLLLPTA